MYITLSLSHTHKHTKCLLFLSNIHSSTEHFQIARNSLSVTLNYLLMTDCTVYNFLIDCKAGRNKASSTPKTHIYGVYLALCAWCHINWQKYLNISKKLKLYAENITCDHIKFLHHSCKVNNWSRSHLSLTNWMNVLSLSETLYNVNHRYYWSYKNSMASFHICRKCYKHTNQPEKVSFTCRIQSLSKSCKNTD